MGSLVITDKGVKELTDWRKWTRPKRSYQWKAGRSAMELARVWFTAPAPVVPPEVVAILETSPLTKGAILQSGQPEYVTPLPELGEGRNHDLWLKGSVGEGLVTVCVEAKADEPFGEPIGAYVEKVLARTARLGQGTKLPQRADTLLKMIFGEEASTRSMPWSNLRYQLLTGVAGTAIQAAKDNSYVGVFLVHEFLTEAVDREQKVPENAAAFADFIKALSRSSAIEVTSGKLYGPYDVRQIDYIRRDVKLLIGKITYDWDNP
jgi:hypothetical protein